MTEQPKTDMTRPVVEMMESGLAIMRVENENLQAMAVQRPRDIVNLSNNAIAELRAFPMFAKKAYYSIPYADRSGGDERTVNVEGPSIKAANALARHWGNNSSGFRVVGTDDERILIQGVFVDHETGMRRTAEMSVARKAWSKKFNKVIPLREDRLNMAIQAGGSKAVRNAILNGLPIGLVEGYFEESKKIAAAGGKVSSGGASHAKDVAENMEGIFKTFEDMGVPRTEVARYVTKHPELESEEAVAAHLIGLINAIQENQINAEDVFAAAPGDPITEPRPTNGQASGSKATPGAQGLDSKGGTTKTGTQPPANWRKMASKIDGAPCERCKKSIAKGAAIYYDPKARVAYHEACA